MTPLLALIAFTVIILSPVLVTGIDAYTSKRVKQESNSSEFIYPYNTESLNQLEAQISRLNNRTSDYKAPKSSMFIDIDIQRVRNIDLNNKTAYISGVLKGAWSEADSLSRGGISPRISYASSRIEDSTPPEDLMNGIELQGLIKDDMHEYTMVSHRKLIGQKGAYYTSEYRFSGNFTFEPSLTDYPADKQSIPISVRHSSLPSYRLRLKPVTTGSHALPSDRAVQNFRVSRLERNDPHIVLPKDNELLRYLSINSKADTERRIPKKALRKFNDLYFANETGPYSVASWNITLERQLSTTWLRYVFPVSLLLIALVVTSYIPSRFTEVRLAIPPTVLLSLVFLQQGSTHGIPDLGSPMLLDYYYLSAYVATLISFVEFIISAYYTGSEHSNGELLFKRASRTLIMLCASVGAPIIWVLGRAVYFLLAN